MSESRTEKRIKRTARRVQEVADMLGDHNSPIPRKLMDRAKQIEKRKREQYRRGKL